MAVQIQLNEKTIFFSSALLLYLLSRSPIREGRTNFKPVLELPVADVATGVVAGGGGQERRWLSAPRVFVDGDGGDGSNSDGGGDLFSSIALRCLPPPPLPIHAADPPASSSSAKVIRAFLLQIASQLWLLLPPRYCCIALILLSPSQFRLHSLNMLNCQGSTAIGIKTKEGVVLAIEKRITSPLLVLARGVDCDLALLLGESEEFWERLLPLFQPLKLTCSKTLRGVPHLKSWLHVGWSPIGTAKYPSSQSLIAAIMIRLSIRQMKMVFRLSCSLHMKPSNPRFDFLGYLLDWWMSLSDEVPVWVTGKRNKASVY